MRVDANAARCGPSLGVDVLIAEGGNLGTANRGIHNCLPPSD